MPMNRKQDEGGFTMITVMLGLSLTVALSLVIVAAVTGDLQQTRNDLDHRRAFEAAKAGVNDYIFHLHKENNYWTHCTDVGPETTR